MSKEETQSQGYATGSTDSGKPKSYNGWANRETWAVALHINNDQGWQESVHEAVRNAVEGLLQDPPPWVVDHTGTASRQAQNVAAGEAVRENVEGWIDYLETRDTPEASGDMRGILGDIGSLWRVDWTELGEAFLSDLAEMDDTSSPDDRSEGGVS